MSVRVTGNKSEAVTGESRGHEAKAKRKYQNLVTIEPALDDEEVLGKAWPLVAEWRWLGRTHAEDGDSLAWLIAEDRRLVLEVTLMEKYGLTLPPTTYPWTGILRDRDLTREGRPFRTFAGANAASRCCSGCVGY